GEDEVALEDRTAPVALDGIEVVPGPERVVAELVGALPDALERGPVDALTPGQRPDLDFTRHLDLRRALAAAAYLGRVGHEVGRADLARGVDRDRHRLRIEHAPEIHDLDQGPVRAGRHVTWRRDLELERRPGAGL